MDGCLDITPIKIPRPSYLSFVDLAIIEAKEKEETLLASAKKKYGDISMNIVIIYKTKPTLGVAIEGGLNTRQPIPKVISIQHGGSAFESGGLKCGHTILEVNDQTLCGVDHREAVRIIADAFQDPSTNCLNLLVTMDSKKT
ncbi:whirlin-like [Saccostrea echinata]|uniref:whirlin-like n=1 Tax=Saccostrea echinata TaxID=191078 RepID=UPI002A80B3B8|nr:whirlin-like [Saccostrea echinata]